MRCKYSTNNTTKYRRRATNNRQNKRIQKHTTKYGKHNQLQAAQANADKTTTYGKHKQIQRKCRKTPQIQTAQANLETYFVQKKRRESFQGPLNSYENTQTCELLSWFVVGVCVTVVWLFCLDLKHIPLFFMCFLTCLCFISLPCFSFFFSKSSCVVELVNIFSSFACVELSGPL